MTLLTRRPDWRARLFAEITRVAGLPLDAGRFDCALFTGGCVEAQTGTDLARGWRGYRTIAEGRRALARAGHADLAASLLPEVAPALAQLGDVALVREGEREALGIVQGAHVWVVGETGLGLVPRERIERAFSV